MRKYIRNVKYHTDEVMHGDLSMYMVCIYIIGLYNIVINIKALRRDILKLLIQRITLFTRIVCRLAKITFIFSRQPRLHCIHDKQ